MRERKREREGERERERERETDRQTDRQTDKQKRQVSRPAVYATTITGKHAVFHSGQEIYRPQVSLHKPKSIQISI